MLMKNNPQIVAFVLNLYLHADLAPGLPGTGAARASVAANRDCVQVMRCVCTCCLALANTRFFWPTWANMTRSGASHSALGLHLRRLLLL